MNFEDYLKDNAQRIEEALETELTDFYKDSKKTNIKLLPFAKHFINSCYGGKTIRGVLVKLGYELAGGVEQEIYKVGAAFEILHTSLLIHDDIIDQSPKRRGKPSLYIVLGGNHYGISQAISVGDIGLYLPIKIITRTCFAAESKIKALNYFSQMLINTGWGQIMDVKRNPLNSSGKDAAFINLFKTAKYTIAGPLQLGAILAGAKEELVKKLGEFGESVGIAFQIRDDILDGEITSKDAHSQVVEYSDRAKRAIPKITTDKEMRQLLEEMTKYLSERKK